MPRPVSWLPRLPEIRRSVANSVRSHYGRRDLELLFHLQPRAANDLLELFPTVLIPGALVEREDLGRFLAKANETDDLAALRLRLRAEKKASSSRRKPRKLILQDSEPMAPGALPAWVKLTPGELSIWFDSYEQMVDGMMYMARILDSNAEEFCRLYCPPPPLSPERLADQADYRTIKKEIESMRSVNEEASHG